MNLQKFLLLIGGAALCSWLAWFTVLLYIDPTTTGAISIIVFYISLSLALLASFTEVGLLLRIALNRWRRDQVVAFKFVTPSLRQASWFTILVITSLMLLAGRLFSWWSITSLIMGFIILEAFFLQHTKDNRPDYPEEQTHV